MRLQTIDPQLHFACQGCTRCCDQPWRTIIEPAKAAALDSVDWGTDFSALAGKKLYRTVRHDGKEVIELAKGEGTRCVFLDADGLCIIHKKLGYAAKPDMCQQFPFLPARAWETDYISANFGCQAIQTGSGPAMTEQAEAIQQTVSLTTRPVDRDAKVLLGINRLISQQAARALLARLADCFATDESADIIMGFARALTLLQQTLACEPGETETVLTDEQARTVDEVPEVKPFSSAAHAPMPCRFLFAATLFQDTLPTDATGNMGFLRRMTLVPKLMALTRMQGGYASRLLGGNVRLDEVLGVPADSRLTAEAAALLCRYIRARLWQQLPAGTQLPICAAVHQHILDVGAIIFYARALSSAAAWQQLDLPVVQKAMMLVEFHLANQVRLYQQVLKGWMMSALDSLGLAAASLRMLRCPTIQPSAIKRPTANAAGQGASGIRR